MAGLKEILSWFEKNKYPTQEQFKESWTSFWHKSEKIPLTQIENINGDAGVLSPIVDVDFFETSKSRTISQGQAIKVGNVWTNIIDSITNEDVNYIEIATYADGSAMDDAKIDGVVYRKRGSTYLKRVYDKHINVRWFGAKGDGCSGLKNYSYSADLDRVFLTSQTNDGIAISEAINVLNRMGEGSLFIPRGTYMIYGYLPDITSNITIIGEGIDITILKNTSLSPTDVNGYGIFCVAPNNYESVKIENLTVDGNGIERNKPTANLRSYPIGVYRKPNLYIGNVKSINSPIDCLMTSYVDDDDKTSCIVENCILDNAFRNSLSIVSGWHQKYIGCRILRGGQVHGGTQPRYCVDVEPNLYDRSIEDVIFQGCTFAYSKSVLFGAVWSKLTISACNFICGDESNPDYVGYPWFFQFTMGQYDITGCSFVGDKKTAMSYGVCYNGYTAGSKFLDDQYVKISNTSFVNGGLNMYGRRHILENILVINSLYPVIIQQGNGIPESDTLIKNMKLVNVLDVDNKSIGAMSSFFVKGNYKGILIIDGLDISIDAEALNNLPQLENIETTNLYGIYMPRNHSTIRQIKATNINVSGFYQDLPNKLGRAISSTNFRDWNVPNLPPDDTESKILGEVGVYWKNCTMKGNY